MAMRRRVDIPQPAPVTRCKNKNPGFFATFLRLGALFRPKKLGSDVIQLITWYFASQSTIGKI